MYLYIYVYRHYMFSSVRPMLVSSIFTIRSVASTWSWSSIPIVWKSSYRVRAQTALEARVRQLRPAPHNKWCAHRSPWSAYLRDSHLVYTWDNRGLRGIMKDRKNSHFFQSSWKYGREFDHYVLTFFEFIYSIIFEKKCLYGLSNHFKK